MTLLKKSILFIVILFILLQAPQIVAAGGSSGSSGSLGSGNSGNSGPIQGTAGSYLICFYADTDGIGHGFVKVRDADGKWRGYGFYPGGTGTLSPVIDDGVIIDDTRHMWEWKICYKITKAQYDKVNETVAEWKTADYYLLGQNCVSFVEDVADNLGIDIPDTGAPDRPGEFAEEIKDSGNGVQNNDTRKTNDTEPDTGHILEGRPEGERTASIQRPSCDIEKYASSRLDALPDATHALLDNQRINLVLQTPDIGEQSVGIVLEGSQIASVGQLLSNPTVTIRTAPGTIKDIGEASDQSAALLVALRSGDMKIISSDPKFKLATLTAKLVRDSPYDMYTVKKNEVKSIIFNGRKSTLTTTSHGTRVIYQPKSNTMQVINRYGTVRGYMPRSGLNIINSNSRYTVGAGIYRQPYTSYSGWSTSVTSYSSYRYTPPRTYTVFRPATTTNLFTRTTSYSRSSFVVSGRAYGGVAVSTGSAMWMR